MWESIAAIADIRSGGFGTCAAAPARRALSGRQAPRASGAVRVTSTRTTASTAWLAQQYLPDELDGKHYYEPKNLGAERDIGSRLERIRRILGDR